MPVLNFLMEHSLVPANVERDIQASLPVLRPLMPSNPSRALLSACFRSAQNLAFSARQEGGASRAGSACAAAAEPGKPALRRHRQSTASPGRCVTIDRLLNSYLLVVDQMTAFTKARGAMPSERLNIVENALALS